MDSLYSLAGSSAVEAAARGLQGAREGLEIAANEVQSATVQAVNGPTGTADTVTIADVASRVPSIEGGLLDAKTASLTYKMNVAVVRTADEQFQDMLNIVVPQATDEG